MAVETTHVVRQLVTATECHPVTGNPIYIGLAEIKSAKANAVWQIRKLTYDGANNLTDIQWANGGAAFDQKWDDRATLPYA